MAETKTRPDSTGIETFLAAVPDGQRQVWARQLHQLFSEVTGYPAMIWGGSMVGYGRYAYRYASGHSGESLATGFAPRKAELVIYILPGYQDFSAILAQLGPHRLGKSCLYIRNLDRIDLRELARLIRAGLDDLATRWPVYPV